MIACNSVEL